MSLEWIRFGVTAVLFISGVFFFASAVLGVWKFGFVMNRIHASGIGDTLGLFLMIAGCIVSSGFNMTSAKLVLIVVFMWFTSPVSGHFLGQIEYKTNPGLRRYMRFPERETGSGPAGEGGEGHDGNR